MNTIYLKNIKVYAFHGCLPEEAKIGSEYIVNLKVKADLAVSEISDDLSDTVDYVHLNRIVKQEMAKRSNLLEHVARRIVKRIFDELQSAKKISLSVAKVNPPIGGDVESVSVILKEGR